jgi:DNA-directed RNA polymerase specialized sigma24 family protein
MTGGMKAHHVAGRLGLPVANAFTFLMMLAVGISYKAAANMLKCAVGSVHSRFKTFL